MFPSSSLYLLQRLTVTLAERESEIATLKQTIEVRLSDMVNSSHGSHDRLHDIIAENHQLKAEKIRLAVNASSRETEYKREICSIKEMVSSIKLETTC